MDIPSRYVYSLVRCVPDPRTGEFVNVAAIAGDPDSEDWSLRQVSSESRVRRLASVAALGAVHTFLARVGKAIDAFQTLPFEGAADLPGEGWLQTLYRDHRNVVQLSPPAPILATSAEDALDVVFSRQLIDPATETRQRAITKHRVLRELRISYDHARLEPHQLRRRAELFVGDRVHAPLDYVVANGRTVQLTQGWSFQGALVDAVSEQVKAWAYAIGRLREGETAHVIDVDEWDRRVERDVDLQVVVAPGTTPEQEDAYGEAQQVFRQLNASVHDLQDVAAVGRRAADLLGIKPGPGTPQA